MSTVVRRLPKLHGKGEGAEADTVARVSAGNMEKIPIAVA